MAVISELSFYPIKSFRGLSVRTLELTRLGPLWDRHWSLIDESGKFLTQRTVPELAKIGLRMDADAGIELEQEGFGSTEFALEEREGDAFPATVWKKEVPVYEVSHEVSAWVSEVIKKKVKLVRMAEGAQREEYEGHPVEFADGAQLLVTSVGSLRDLEKRAGVSLSMARFRANIVVDGVSAYAEDEWGGFKVGSLEFKALRPCSRCAITTVHPLTGVRGEEPLKTLATYRRQGKGIMFGCYFANLNVGKISVGDTLKF